MHPGSPERGKDMQSKTETKFYFHLRLYTLKKEVWPYYAYDVSPGWRNNREWAPTHDQPRAYRFGNRSDARTALRGVTIKKFLKDHNGWFWEIVKITETIVTSYAEELVVSDAPAMVQLGRAAS
jgi:hypothetical protein